MHTKLTIPERLKDLRVSEKRMSLQELYPMLPISLAPRLAIMKKMKI